MPSPSSAPETGLDSTLRFRGVCLSLGLATAFSLLGWRLVNLHVGQGDQFQQAVRPPAPREVELPATRGTLFDHRGEVLALDRRSFTVVVDRNVLRDFNLALRAVGAELRKKPKEVLRYYTEEQIRQRSVQRCLGLLAPELDMSVAALHSEIGDAPRGEVVVKRDLGEEEAQSVKEFVDEHTLPGIFVRASQRRMHPFPGLAVHVIGFTNNENTGVEGIEKSMDADLRGVPGKQWFDRNPMGGEVPSTSQAVVPPQPGRSLRLTLDLEIQRLLEAELDMVGDDPDEVWVPRLKARGVTVVLMDPATNSILAMANRPHHNLDELGSITPNLAVSETFEPGSTFKLGAYVGALDSKLVGLATPLNLHGGTYDKGEIHIRDDHPVSDATVLKAFSHSSNIAAYKLASQLGAQRYFNYLVALGFGHRTGVDIPNEATGRLRHPNRWGTLSMRSLSFGYEVNVTPLQLLNAYSAVVNDGILRKPRLVEAILDHQGGVVEERPTVVVDRVCSSTTAQHLRTAMLEVVKKGTAKKAAIPGYLVGGKTGTAQKYVPARKAYAPGSFVVSFVGFAESVRGPELLGVVVVDDAEVSPELEYGGHLAAPIFRRIARKVLALRNVEPNPDWLPVMADDRGAR